MTGVLAPDLPTTVQANAWTGEAPASGPLGRESVRWALQRHGESLPRLLAPEEPADPRDWHDPRVGWGLVLPDDDALPADVKARGEDAPEPLRALLASRPGSPVLRYRPSPGTRFTHLRRYYETHGAQDVALSASARGVREGALPRYLLVYGGPDVIPWEFQYLLNQACAAGRLSLTGVALENYVSALIGGWPNAAARSTSAVVWAVDHGAQDISHLMRETIAERIQGGLAADGEIRARYLDGSAGDATRARLCEALADAHPGLVVTTSHGKTGPLNAPQEMLRDLGLPVDGDHTTVDPATVLDAWEPDGAIWYAHACCSAGSDGSSIFSGLMDPGSQVERLLAGIAELGAHVAPLPEALLGAPKPLRAFVGHVEPTFDWTISHPDTGQPLTTSLKEAFYDHLFQPEPLGLAMREPYRHVGEFYGQRDAAYRAFEKGEDVEAVAMVTQLAARDRQSMVILGDPTVMLPPLPSRATGG